MSLPRAGSALLLLAALAAAVGLAADTPGPGPLALITTIAAAHAALVPHGGLISLVLALPAVCAVSYGRAAWPLYGSLLLVTLAAYSGIAGRRLKSKLYLPSMLLVFLAPFALAYLVVEFGNVAHANTWRSLSPVAAAQIVAADGAIPGACMFLLLWPVYAAARRGK